MEKINKIKQLKNYDKLFKIKIQNYINVDNTNSFLKQQILCHLCINLMSILLKMFIRSRKLLQSMVFFFLKVSYTLQQFLIINSMRKAREFDRILKWTNFIKIIERKKLYKKESKRKIVPKKNFYGEICSTKKKTMIIKKFKKFYSKYLGIILEIKNNIIVWKFLKKFVSNRLKSPFFILLKDSGFFYINIKIFDKINKMGYFKKRIKQKNSLCRSLILIRKNMSNNTLFFF